MRKQRYFRDELWKNDGALCVERDGDCPHCGASLLKAPAKPYPWNRRNGKSERRGNNPICCKGGKRVVRTANHPNILPPLPDELVDLYRKNDFKTLCRDFNGAVRFTAIGFNPGKKEGGFGRTVGKLDNADQERMRYGYLHMNGQSYARLFPFDHETCPMQYWIRDGATEHVLSSSAARLARKPEYLDLIRRVLQRTNALARQLISVGENSPGGDVTSVRLELQWTPRAGEVAAIVQFETTPEQGTRTFVIHDGQRKITVRPTNQMLEALSYPLLFPHASPGWHYSLREEFGELDWYRQLMMREERFGRVMPEGEPSSCLGRLVQEYMCDMWSRYTEDQFRWLRENQDAFRVGRKDELKKPLTREDSKTLRGQTKVPSSIIGSPAHFREIRQDALELVRRFGRPTYFITLTCNPHWTEFKTLLPKGQNIWDRVDIANRVFRLKLDQMLTLMRGENGIFGSEIYCIHVIEYQKRGMPHAHIALKVEAKAEPESAAEIDARVCAHLPPEKDFLHKRVRKLHMHECGDHCRNGATGLCRSHFPYPLNPRTFVDPDTGYVHHKRVQPSTGPETEKRGDEWVVQYNRQLLFLWDGQCNVQVAHTVNMVFYLFKYLFKGSDYVKFSFKNARESGVPIDEIDMFEKGRYFSATECCWRIFCFHTHEQRPPVNALPVHTEGQNAVGYSTRGDNQEEEQSGREKKEKLNRRAKRSCALLFT